MHRVIQPELLDSLPADHPDALRNRRDLHLTNHLMGNYRWFARTLPTQVRAGESVLELGAGTGEMGGRLRKSGLVIDGLDLWPRPANWPVASEWHRDDLLKFEQYGRYPVVMGNLIFHQFRREELALLGEKLSRSTRLIMASEPVRRRFSQIAFAGIAPLAGANHVSRHDARVSIAAGFCGEELPQQLGLSSVEWAWTCFSTLFGAYRMIAVRRK
ncbi:MAG: hypothetical protein ABI273_13695 [Lacunisphaera sp.]